MKFIMESKGINLILSAQRGIDYSNTVKGYYKDATVMLRDEISMTVIFIPLEVQSPRES